MEPKCGYCDLFGEKYHCNNCKLIKTRTVQNNYKYLNNYSLEDIIAMKEMDIDFKIGDNRKIQLLTGEEIDIIYLGSNVDELSDGSGTAKATFIATLEGQFPMEPESHNTYRLSRMRNTYLPRFFKLLPPVLQENIKMVKKPVYDSGHDRIIADNTKLWLLSENEVFGKIYFSNGGEGEQYEFFTSKNKIKSICPSNWWLRSPKAGGRDWFCCVGSGGDPNYYWSGAAIAVVFGFCI